MNNFGRIFKVSIFGESHGESVGIVIDGCPAGISLSRDTFMEDIGRRKSGAAGTTTRKEADEPMIKSGIFNGKTTGAPITILFENQNKDSEAYYMIKDTPRPGHTDFVAMKKYGGFNDFRGSGHFSGRLTLGLVAAGVLAKKIISPLSISATLIEAGGSNNVDEAVKKAMEEKDSIGGIVECVVKNVTVGLGEPFFDSVESLISHAIFSIPAIKGIEFGSGFAASKMHGSEHNDPIINVDGKTKTNHSGGINGGITNGNDIVFRVAIKPTPSIGKVQRTMNFKAEKEVDLSVEGKHDACVALRVPVAVEAVTAITLADLCLLEQRLSR